MSWKWYACRSTAIPAASASADELGDLVRDADADRVTEADLVGAELDQPARDVDGGLGRHAPRVRTAERGRDVGASPPPEVARPGKDRRESRQRRIDGHPDVPLGEGVGRRGEDRDRVHADCLGARHPAFVRYQDRITDARPAPQVGEQGIRIGELRDRPRRDE